MVMPGVTTRKPRVKRGLFGRRTEVHRLPRNEHGHDGSLAGTRRELEGQTRETGIGLFARQFDPIQEGGDPRCRGAGPPR